MAIKFKEGEKVRIVSMAKLNQVCNESKLGTSPGINAEMWNYCGNVVTIHKGERFTTGMNIYYLSAIASGKAARFSWREDWLEKLEVKKIKVKDFLKQIHRL